MNKKNNERLRFRGKRKGPKKWAAFFKEYIPMCPQSTAIVVKKYVSTVSKPDD